MAVVNPGAPMRVGTISYNSDLYDGLTIMCRFRMPSGTVFLAWATYCGEHWRTGQEVSGVQFYSINYDGENFNFKIGAPSADTQDIRFCIVEPDASSFG